MAFCPQCGASNPDGARFCTNCGGSLPVQSGSQSNANGFSAPAYTPAPAAPRKSNKGLIIGLVAALLVIAAVIGVLFLTGVLGGKSGPEGTWTLSSSTDSSTPAGSIVLVLEKGGTGTATVRDMSRPLTWSADVITINNSAAKYTLDGDTLTIIDDGFTYVFTRGGAAAGNLPAAPVFPAEPTPEPTPEATPEDPMPLGTWTGDYVYNGGNFHAFFILKADNTYYREIYRDGELVKEETGTYVFDGNEVRLYANGDTGTWTPFDLKDGVLVNNEHYFYRS